MDNEKHKPLTDIEKTLLKERIATSVYTLKTKRLRLRYALSAAASIALVMSFGAYYFTVGQEVSITDYVNSTKNIDVNGSENVVLILNDTANVQIEEDATTINYSKTGKKVDIGVEKSIHQKTIDNSKVVFNSLLVPYGKRSKIKLSDGSMVWLNSGSKLVYPSFFAGEKREVYLEGEAIFEVTHDEKHPFKVISEGQEVHVLGTVFNVTSYPDDKTIKTVLKSGSVEIDYTNGVSGKKLKITPGTLAQYNKQVNRIETKKVDVYDYFSWRDGVLIFRNNDLNHIMAKLSRYYNVTIEVKGEDLAKETFSGYLDLNNNVENVIAIIKETTDFEFQRIETDKIIINK